MGLRYFNGPKGFPVRASQMDQGTGTSQEYQVQFYESSDLVNWELLSEFGPAGSTEKSVRAGPFYHGSTDRSWPQGGTSISKAVVWKLRSTWS